MNLDQFKEFMEMFSKTISETKPNSKKNNHVRIKSFFVTTPKDLKKAIATARQVESDNYYNEIALNYAAIADKLNKFGHFARNCLSEKANQQKEGNEKRIGNQTRELNYCALMDKTGNKEMYNIDDEEKLRKTEKRLAKTEWIKVQQPERVEETQDMDIDPDKQKNVEPLDPREKGDGSESESGDTFDEFEYEDEVEELENKWDIEEENPALYLMTIEEVPTEDNEDKKKVQ
ncbi:27285_t:CDS:2 [Gigaspora margarita]|uniref:27285_t:CDS:1 n=1 Tax=Gigaspora margarita TaxID=4874 RepID=A0ABN7UTU2_GIGMA|nr:27285_t:CDS:2 [Gigaspora margarita]